MRIRIYVLSGLTSFRVLLLLPSSSLCTIFDAFSSKKDQVLSINLSANVLAFGDFNVHHKDWLICSRGTCRPGELCYNFSEMTFLRCLALLLVSVTMTFTVLLFWISFFLLTLVFFFCNDSHSIGRFWSYCCLSFHWLSINL